MGELHAYIILHVHVCSYVCNFILTYCLCDLILISYLVARLMNEQRDSSR